MDSHDATFEYSKCYYRGGLQFFGHTFLEGAGFLGCDLRERAPERLVQIAKIADQYLEAHGKHLFSSASKKPQVQPKVEETKTAQSDTTALQ